MLHLRRGQMSESFFFCFGSHCTNQYVQFGNKLNKRTEHMALSNCPECAVKLLLSIPDAIKDEPVVRSQSEEQKHPHDAFAFPRV